jgi:predicted Rossmann fold flavoprotein
MHIGIIGGGASGLYTAIAIKKKHPEMDVTVIEKEEKIARKLYATGNGHCNLLNKKLLPSFYSHPDFVAPFIESHPYSALKSTLASWGIEVFEDGDYVYPLSYDAGTYAEMLVKIARSLQVCFLQATFKDYQNTKKGFECVFAIDNERKTLMFDKIVFAFGGASTPKLGSDGKLFPIIEKHGYRITPLRPGLAPLRIQHPERVKALAGFRHEADICLLSDGRKVLYEEKGELLFKPDGLSGIVIFNVESHYLRLRNLKHAFVSVNLFPQWDSSILLTTLSDAKKANPVFYLDGFLPRVVQEHFLSQLRVADQRNLSEKDLYQLTLLLQCENYEIKEPYGFESSQVTVGGLNVDDVTLHCESKSENGVYFAGELLDIDGNCGGYNLSWALLSGLVISEVI